MANPPETRGVFDVLGAAFRSLPDVEVVVFSPPCGPYSKMGKGKALEDPYAKVTKPAFDALKRIDFKIAIMEQVATVLTKKDAFIMYTDQ